MFDGMLSGRGLDCPKPKTLLVGGILYLGLPRVHFSIMNTLHRDSEKSSFLFSDNPRALGTAAAV